MTDYDNKKFAEFLGLISDIILFGQNNGEFRTDINIHVAKQSIFGAIYEISSQWHFMKRSKRFDLEKSILSFIDVYIAGLCTKL